ncbi:hypothetical protein N7474_005959 [Penicillium riverlandense]|uniref:uncharacterized protein n=1 Tax=Penicillium riverlandense TaxID=1903569 RepID=UPI0025484C04|nr:uncharacterized protein N7474_005959 [Penicillium riverlandense]KAJ5820368.1 hypothetical protein N7474_005959 [Penicillium riverlandense]
MHASSKSQQAATRRYGFACLICRRRKIKCDGKKPNCANCVKAKEICNYKESSSYNAHLVHQAQQSKKRAEDLEAQLRDLASLSPESRDHRLTEIVRDLDHLHVSEGSPGDMSEFSQSYEADKESHEELPYSKPTDFSVGEHGTYYGATSRFHPLDSNDISPARAPQLEGTEHKATEEYHRKWLASNARFQESFEKVALSHLFQYTDVGLDVCSTLLQIFWTWQAPLHNYVYRRCFYRDMALNGPYFSPFLLNAIFAHASRHTKDEDPRFAGAERGEYFLRKAKQFLLVEMDQEKPKICTAQGLLILGGRQCAIGKSSEGWLYTGMAIRMITDLGIHLYRGNLEGLDGLEPDDLEVRKRLYLSAYHWDKSISLCLGRQPCLPDLPYAPDSLFDTSDNDDEWRPYSLREIEDSYPSTKSYGTITFVHFCKLAKIINESYDKVYSRSPQHLKPQSIFELEAKLRSFYQSLPEPLKIAQATSLQFCHPPHIFCLNILYHTMLILIFRPFFGWSRHSKLQDHALARRAQKVCIEEATEVNEFFRQYGRTFNYQNQTYLVSYCVYTTATIDVQMIQNEDVALATAAVNRLSTTLEMLESEARQTPGIKRSIDIIKSHLAKRAQAGPQESSVIHHSPEQQRRSLYVNVPEQRPHHRPGIASSPSSHLENRMYRENYSSIAPPTGDQTPDENIGHILTQAMDVDTPWRDWEFFNAGGGFVPSHANWAPFDPAYNYHMD